MGFGVFSQKRVRAWQMMGNLAFGPDDLFDRLARVWSDIAGCPCLHPRYFEGKCVGCLKPEGAPDLKVDGVLKEIESFRTRLAISRDLVQKVRDHADRIARTDTARTSSSWYQKATGEIVCYLDEALSHLRGVP